MTRAHTVKVAGTTGHSRGASREAAPPVRRLHVLVVDDNPVLRQVIRRTMLKYFSASVATVTEAKDGLSALDQVETGAVDLVVLDLQMPMMSGIDVLETVRRSPDHAHLPIVVVTGSTEADVVSRLLQLGVAGYLVKPLSVAVLRERLAVVIDAASRRPAVEEGGGGARRRWVDLKPTSQVLILEQDPDLRRFWLEQLKGVAHVDEATTSTAALRRHHQAMYDIIVVGNYTGLLDPYALADKLREMSPLKPANVLALVPGDAAAAARQGGRYDGVLIQSTDVKEWLGQLAMCLNAASTTRLLLGPSSPYVNAMFTKAGELLHTMLKADVAVQPLPSDLDSGGRWFSARVPIKIGDMTWQLWLTGKYVFGLAMATASQGLAADHLSESQVLSVVGGLTTAIAETLRDGFKDVGVECRLKTPISEVRDSPPMVAGSTRDASRWLFAEKLNQGASLRLVPDSLV